MKKKLLEPTEHQSQAAYIEWCGLHESKYHPLKYLFAIPNGGYKLPIGVAMKLKREGVRRGPPDICLPYFNGKYNGFWNEFKTSIGKLSDEQADFALWLRNNNFYHCVSRSTEEAIIATERYLKNLL